MPHPANDGLRISDAGLTLIERFEGFKPDWYLDPVGVRTIAYGWTGALPDGLAPPLTQAQGRQLLRDTVGSYERAVRRHVAVPLAQAQFDALVSFTYNLGASNLASSTLLRRLNEGDARAAAEQFDRWVLAGGRALPGLVRRRAAERALFESGTGPNDRIAAKPPRALEHARPTPDLRVPGPVHPEPSAPLPSEPPPRIPPSPPPTDPGRTGW